MSRATFTKHALQRMREMGVDEGEVRSAMAYPVTTRPDYRGPKPATYYIGRRISAVVDEDKKIVTVLWSDPDVVDILQPGRRRTGRRAP